MRCATLAIALLGVCSTLVASQRSESSPAESTNGELLARRLPRLGYLGGPFIRRPRVVTVTFAGDDARVVARLERFGATVTRTSWWRAVVDGYCATDDDCLGDGQAALAVRLDDALAADVHAVDLSARLKHHAGAGRFGPLDAELALLVYLPAGIRLRDASVARYCDGPRAFHRALRFDGRTVAYAVIPRCGDEAEVTGTASHELVEMVMNPDTARRGFAFVTGSFTRAFTAAGSEAMDPCGFITQDTDILESGFTVRRSWSNRAASEGRNPCVPSAAAHAYVALVPREPAIGLRNDGDSASIALEAAADRPVEKWSVSVVDLTGSQEHDRFVETTLDKSEVRPGETVTLRITRRKRHPKGFGIVGLVSTLDGRSHLWPVAVVTR